ncbi:MAG: PKD domain-containing protein [Cytophagales bacterium]|nr:MAG: PKD domain-containing protein [Cytophagales bacterium]
MKLKTRKLFLLLTIGISSLFLSFTNIDNKNSTTTKLSKQPFSIAKNNATPICSLTVRATYRNDSLYLQYFIRKQIAATFQLGNANLIISLDPEYFDISKSKIKKRSAWDALYNPSLYRPLQLSFNNTSKILSLNIEHTSTTNLGISPPNQDSMIAEVAVPVIKCIENYPINWNKNSPQGEILNTLGTSIYSETFFQDGGTVNACPCDASFTGLGNSYCTSSFLSKLTPKINGGVFSGAGVNFSNGIWYFKAFDAGPGTHTIKYILPCGDTASKTISVEAAPCQSLGGQDITGGFAFVTQPRGLFTDCNGEIYATSQLDQTVYKIDSFGVKEVIAGVNGIAGYIDGPSNTALFNFPTGVIKSSINGNIYVVDGRNQVIREINTTTNQVTTIAGSFNSDYGTSNDDGIGASAKFSTQGIGITFNKTQDTLYVTESSNGLSSGQLGQLYKFIFRVRQISLITKEVKTIAGGAYALAPSPSSDTDKPIGTNTIFRGLGHLSADNNYLYVADQTARKIRKINLIAPHAVTTIAGPSGFSSPISASVSGNGIVYSADQNECTIKEVSQFPTTSIKIVAGSANECYDSDTTFQTPNATSVFVKGFIDVADFGSGKIKRVGIKDYGSLPFKGTSKKYCYNGVTDTLNYILGSYSGNGISKVNNLWIFNPVVAGIGKHVITYSFDLNTCNASFTDTFIVFPKPKPFKGINKTICDNELGKFQLDAGPGQSYQWFRNLPNQIINGQNKRLLTISTTGIYSVSIRDTMGCIGGDTITLNSIAASKVSLGPDINLCAGFKTPLSFTPNSGIQSILWYNGTSNLTDTAFGGGIYHVTIKDANGCFSTDSLNVISSLPPTPLISSVPEEKCVAFVKTKTTFQRENTFLTPQLQGMVIDSKGNTFITDFENNLIRRINKSGTQSIYAGQGTDPFGNSLANVRIRKPYGITIDRNDNLYITEVTENIVRKITPTGVVSIYAGVYGNTNGYNGDGKKDTIILSQPTAIDIDETGNIYITEFQSHIIRKITPLGFTQTIGIPNNTGDQVGNFNEAKFNRPQALTIDKAGFIYVADFNENIKKINPFNKKVTQYTQLPSTVSANVKGIAIDNLKRMYITMNTNYTIYYVDPRDSSTVYYAGIPNSGGTNDGLMTNARFQDLQGLYLNERGGALYAVDKNSVRIITDSCGVTICEGYLATLTANPHPSYEWNNNPAQNTRSISVGTAGRYFVKVGNSVGCTFYDTINVSVIPKPNITVSKDTTICEGDTIQISALVNPINPNDTIQWFKNGNLIKQTIGIATNTIKANSGTYTAVVRTGKLCLYSLSTNVNNTKPILNAFASPDTVCQGQAVQLQVAVTNARPPLKYLWTGEVITNNTSATPSANPLNAGQNNYIVKVTDADGCINSDTALLFVKPRPNITTLKDTNVCLGSTIVLFTTVSGGKLPYRSLFWIPTTGLSDPNSLSPSITPTDSVVYQISVTDSDNCTSRDEIKIGVIKFEVSPATTDSDTICPSSKAQLNVTASKGSGNYSYNWSPANGLSATNIRNPIAQPSASTEYSVVVKDNVFFCEATRTVKVNAINLSVELGNNINNCVNDANINLLTNVTGGTKPYLYIWSPNTGLSNSSIPNPEISFTKVENRKYMLSVTDASGCTQKDSIEISTNDLPIISKLKDTLVCNGSTFSLSTSLITGSSPITYTWRNKLNNQSTTGNPIDILLRDSVTYFVNAIDANGCRSKTDSINIGVIKINTSIDASPSFVCPNNPIQLQSTVKGGIGKIVYLWSPVKNVNDISIPTPIGLIDKTTYFKLKVTDELGCSAEDSTLTTFSSLEVNTGNNLLGCISNPVKLGATLVGGTEPYQSIEWTPSIGLNNSTVLNPTFTPTTNGKFELVITAIDKIGCSDKDTIVIEINPAPIANAGNDNAYCFGNEATIGGSPTATGGSGVPYTFTWQNNDNEIISTNESNPKVKVTKNSSYIVTITDAAQCSDSDTINITSLTLPSIAIVKNKDAVCVGDSLNLSINSNSNNLIYSWKNLQNNAVISSSSNLNVKENGSFRAIITDVNNQCSDSSETNISFTNPPSNLRIEELSALCINTPINLIASAQGDELSYKWTTINGFGKFSNTLLPNTNYLPNETLDPINPNAITIKLMVSNLCRTDSITKNIFINPVTKASFKTSVKESLAGDPISFINITDTINKGVLKYQWIFGDGTTTNSFNSTHIYNNAGGYEVLLTVRNSANCIDTANMMIEIINSQILYIPNAFSPSADNFENRTSKIYGSALLKDNFEWNIYNRWGEVIFNTNNIIDAQSKGWNGTFKNTGEELPKGVYTYTLKAKLNDGKMIEKTGTISLIR